MNIELLNLTDRMIQLLLNLNDCEINNKERCSHYSHFVPTVKALERRGLIYHNKNWFHDKNKAYTLTELGKQTVKLIMEHTENI